MSKYCVSTMKPNNEERETIPKKLNIMLSNFSKSGKTAIFATIYLIMYAALLYAGVSDHIMFLLLIPTPLIVIYLVYVVITDKKEDMREFKEDEEFSYQDWPGASKPKEDS